jgi:large conductance mechanosensitive channel
MLKFIHEYFTEFRKFAMRGNVMDMAIGVVIGAAFGKIVTSLVGDIITPLLGMWTGPVNFSDRTLSLGAGNVLRYGNFINTTIDFVIIAFCIFFVMRQMNRLKQFLPKEEATTKTCPECLSTIPIKAKRCAFCTSVVEDEKPSA